MIERLKDAGWSDEALDDTKEVRSCLITAVSSKAVVGGIGKKAGSHRRL
jgi:hypothetical protein